MEQGIVHFKNVSHTPHLDLYICRFSPMNLSLFKTATAAKRLIFVYFFLLHTKPQYVSMQTSMSVDINNS